MVPILCWGMVGGTLRAPEGDALTTVAARSVYATFHNGDPVHSERRHVGM